MARSSCRSLEALPGDITDRFELWVTGDDEAGKRLLHFPGYNLRARTFEQYARAILETAPNGHDSVAVFEPRLFQGRRSRPPRSVEEYMTFYRQGLRALSAKEGGVRPYSISGHSWGATVATFLACDLQEEELSPERAILINPAVPRELLPVQLVWRAVRGHLEESHAAKGMLRYLLGHAVFVDYTYRLLRDFSSLYRGLHDVSCIDLGIEPITIPAYVLLSQHDRLFEYTEEDRELFRQLYPHPETHVRWVKGARHNFPLRRPRKSASLASGYLRRTSLPRAA